MFPATNQESRDLLSNSYTTRFVTRSLKERARFTRRERVERPGEGYSLFQVTKKNEGFFGTEFSIPRIFG